MQGGDSRPAAAAVVAHVQVAAGDSSGGAADHSAFEADSSGSSWAGTAEHRTLPCSLAALSMHCMHSSAAADQLAAAACHTRCVHQTAGLGVGPLVLVSFYGASARSALGPGPVPVTAAGAVPAVPDTAPAQAEAEQ